MQSLKIFPVFQFIILLMSCSNDNCKDTYVLDRIEFFNYKLRNVENIRISAYKKDNNFQTPVVDSFKIIRFEKLDTYGYDNYGFLDKSINTNYDYDIYFKDLNSHCKITGIKVNEEVCNEGLFSNDYSHSFDEYYLDGLLFKCQVLKASP